MKSDPTMMHDDYLFVSFLLAAILEKKFIKNERQNKHDN
jgi:hypothetical protein